MNNDNRYYQVGRNGVMNGDAILLKGKMGHWQRSSFTLDVLAYNLFEDTMHEISLVRIKFSNKKSFTMQMARTRCKSFISSFFTKAGGVLKTRDDYMNRVQNSNWRPYFPKDFPIDYAVDFIRDLDSAIWAVVMNNC